MTLESDSKPLRPERGSRQRRRSGRVGRQLFGLQGKVVGFLLIVAVVPLVVAGFLLDQSARLALNFAANEAEFMRPPLERARNAYVELIESKRDLYYPQVGLRVAGMPAIATLTRAATSEPRGEYDARAVDETLEALIATTRELVSITVLGPDGQVLAARETLAPLGVDWPDWRTIEVRHPVARTRATLVLGFAANTRLQAEYATLSRTLEDVKHIDEVRSALPASYRKAFFYLVGGVVLLVSIAGLWLARRFIKRIHALVTVTRRVAAGDMQARARIPSRDELTELGRAFNRMVEELEHDREQIAYLQRVGAWQDVARKLAHEIKNPLTPIQLAVQQCVSSYKGDDERFTRLLRDTEEIVTEEIANLRRLVDAFRTLGQLPRVAPEPMALGDLVEELLRDPMLLDVLDIEPPATAVMIRGDRLLLRRVLTNLVENGVHAGREARRAGRVRIRWFVELEEERVRVHVDDEGPGVPEDRRDKIFEPYITHKEEGTGLGLTISKKIVLEHGGALSLASEASELGGARFVVLLPIADDADGGDGDADGGSEHGPDPGGDANAG